MKFLPLTDGKTEQLSLVQFACCFEVCLKSICEKYKWNTLAVSEWIFVRSDTGDFY